MIITILKFLPPILVLMSLLDIWITKESFEKHLGKKSGAMGNILALILGSLTAGPLFTAFPIGKSFYEKGMRTSNLVIFLSAWGTIKIPMFLMEASFVGLKFAAVRFLITVPFIFLIGWVMEKGEKLFTVEAFN